MSSIKFVEKMFQGTPVRFEEDGWFCATDFCAISDYRLQNWFDDSVNKRWMCTVSKRLGEKEPTFEKAYELLVKTKNDSRGSSTWFHPELAFYLSMTVDDDFAVSVMRKIETLASEK